MIPPNGRRHAVLSALADGSMYPGEIRTALGQTHRTGGLYFLLRAMADDHLIMVQHEDGLPPLYHISATGREALDRLDGSIMSVRVFERPAQ